MKNTIAELEKGNVTDITTLGDLSIAAHSSPVDELTGSSSSRLPELFIFSWLWSMPIMFVAGVIVMLIYALQVPIGLRWSVFVTAIAIGSSALFIGGIAGFLFGIPRTVYGAVRTIRGTHYRGNTNLEQVSDWLTKIVVGIGLVQIGRIIPALSRFADSMKEPLGGQPSSAAFGLGLSITYALLGFLYYYLWSRSLFARELGISNEDLGAVSLGAGPE